MYNIIKLNKNFKIDYNKLNKIIIYKFSLNNYFPPKINNIIPFYRVHNSSTNIMVLDGEQIIDLYCIYTKNHTRLLMRPNNIYHKNMIENLGSLLNIKNNTFYRILNLTNNSTSVHFYENYNFNKEIKYNVDLINHNYNIIE